MSFLFLFHHISITQSLNSPLLEFEPFSEAQNRDPLNFIETTVHK